MVGAAPALVGAHANLAHGGGASEGGRLTKKLRQAYGPMQKQQDPATLGATEQPCHYGLLGVQPGGSQEELGTQED